MRSRTPTISLERQRFRPQRLRPEKKSFSQSATHRTYRSCVCSRGTSSRSSRVYLLPEMPKLKERVDAVTTWLLAGKDSRGSERALLIRFSQMPRGRQLTDEPPSILVGGGRKCRCLNKSYLNPRGSFFRIPYNVTPLGVKSAREFAEATAIYFLRASINLRLMCGV